MTFALKNFTDGQLPSTKTTIYTALAPMSFRVTLVNTSSSMLKVNLYIDSNGTSRRIVPKNMELNGQYSHHTKTFQIEKGDHIEGDAGAASWVDYRIDGFML